MKFLEKHRKKEDLRESTGSHVWDAGSLGSSVTLVPTLSPPPESHYPGQNNKDAQTVRNFLETLGLKVRIHEVWRHCNDQEWSNTVEGLEKFVMGKIFSKVFAPTKREKRLDLELRRRIDRYGEEGISLSSGLL